MLPGRSKSVSPYLNSQNKKRSSESTLLNELKRLRLSENAKARYTTTTRFSEIPTEDPLYNTGTATGGGGTTIGLPLDMNKVFELLLPTLSIEDQKNCRLVSKSMKEMATESLINSWPHLKHLELKLDKKFCQTMLDSKDKKMFCKYSGPLEEFSKFSEFFFTQHEVRSLSIYLKEGMVEIKQLAQVLERASNFLQNLKIRAESRCLILFEDFRDVNFPFYLPHLEKLSLKFDQLTGPQWRDNCLRLFLEITRVSPGLSNLKFHHIPMNLSIPSHFQNDYYDLTNTVKPDLEKLSMVFQSSNEINGIVCEPFRFFETGLKYLELRIPLERNEQHYDANLIENYLQGKAETLEILKIYLGIEIPQVKVDLPYFSKLKKCILGNYLGPINYFPYEQIDLENFPQLVEICLDFSQDFHSWDKIFHGCAPRVGKLELRKCTPIRSYCSSRNNHILEKNFPNIQKFKIDDKRAIWKEQGANPWEKSLKIISIGLWIHEFEHFDFKILQNFNELSRIEIFCLNQDKSSHIKPLHVNFKSLFKLSRPVKSIKIDNFWIAEWDLTILRKNYILDYKPNTKF